MARLATIASLGFPDFDPATLLPVYRRWGCETCQYYRNIQNQPTLATALKFARDAGLVYDSVHGLFGIEYDPSNPDELVRRRAMDIYHEEGRLGLELGGPMVVVHPGPPATNDNGPVTPQTRLARLDALTRSMEELAAWGTTMGVTFLIENIPANYHLGGHPEELAQMIRTINAPSLRMCFDVGHAHMTGNAAAALEACADVIAYLHVHDNDSLTESHMIPGRGSVDWPAIGRAIAKLPRHTPAMLELFDLQPVIESEIAKGLPGKLVEWLGLGKGR